MWADSHWFVITMQPAEVDTDPPRGSPSDIGARITLQEFSDSLGRVPAMSGQVQMQGQVQCGRFPSENPQEPTL
jgi:hypothetical protein